MPGKALPVPEGVAGEGAIVVAAVSGDLFAEPGGAVEGVVFGRELDFGDGKPGVVAMEFVDFPRVAAIGVMDKVAGLVDQAACTERYQVPGFGKGDFLFPFEAAESPGVAGPLYGQDAAVVADANSRGTLWCAAKVSLGDTEGAVHLFFIIALNQKLSLYLLSHLLFPIIYWTWTGKAASRASFV